MNKPKAVIISDVHYSVHTLDIADKAMNMAIDKAIELKVPLVIAGDLHDTKANMRAECVNRMIKTFELAFESDLEMYVLRGNHDQINEKSAEHALEFLVPYATIVDYPIFVPHIGYFIPYQHDANEFKRILTNFDKDIIIIAHQGLAKTNAGHYFQDHSAVNPEDVAGRTIISGHYHARQSIALAEEGQWDYIGNPYTLDFGEANHPAKGFQVLLDDCSLNFVPTKLRKHVIIDNLDNMPLFTEKDLIWVKITDTKENLIKLNKEKLAELLSITQPFKLDLIPLSRLPESVKSNPELGQDATLDNIIESLTNSSQEQKNRLKLLWRAL